MSSCLTRRHCFSPGILKLSIFWSFLDWKSSSDSRLRSLSMWVTFSRSVSAVWRDDLSWWWWGVYFRRSWDKGHIKDKSEINQSLHASSKVFFSDLFKCGTHTCITLSSLYITLHYVVLLYVYHNPCWAALTSWTSMNLHNVFHTLCISFNFNIYMTVWV